jgi:hypothetical protein
MDEPFSDCGKLNLCVFLDARVDFFLGFLFRHVATLCGM